MKRRWVWVARQADHESPAISILAVIETAASVSVFLFYIAFFDFGAGMLLAAFITPLFFLRSPDSQESTKSYFQRAVNRPHRFQLYGMLVALTFLSLEAPLWSWIFIVPVGYVFGHLYNAWYVQFSRSLFYFREGLGHLSENYFTTLFATDITTRPEMFPGSKNVNAIPHWEHTIFFFPPPRSVVTFVLSVMNTLVLFCVVLLRFSAKATALVCLPLIYFSWPSHLLTNRHEQLIWIKSQPAKSIEFFRFLLALTVLLSLIIAILDTTKIFDIEDIFSVNNPARLVATLYYVTDLSDVRIWQGISVVSAAISVVLYFVMDGCRKEAIAGRQDFSWRLRLIIQGQRLRTFLSLFWLLVAAYFSAEFYYFECKIEGFVEHTLSYFWGVPSCKEQ